MKRDAAVESLTVTAQLSFETLIASQLIKKVTPSTEPETSLPFSQETLKLYHHHHISFMELGHLLTHPSLTYPQVSSKVYHDSFCQLGCSISFPWVIYFEVFYLHVVSSFPFIRVICPKLVLFLNPLQFVHLFCNLFRRILLFFSCISSLLLLFFWRYLL